MKAMKDLLRQNTKRKVFHRGDEVMKDKSERFPYRNVVHWLNNEGHSLLQFHPYLSTSPASYRHKPRPRFLS